MPKHALFKGGSTLVAMVTTAACSRPGPHFHTKTSQKRQWNVYFSISSWIQHYKLALLPYIVTSFVLYWFIQFSLGVNVNTPIDYSSRYSFGHFCCRVKQGKRLSEFLQKYTDSGTETTHLAGYNILVFKYVKISAGLPLLFIGAIREKSSKSDIA